MYVKRAKKLKSHVLIVFRAFQDQVEVPNGHVDIGSGNQLDPIPEQPEQGEQRTVLSRFGLQVPGFGFQRFQ